MSTRTQRANIPLHNQGHNDNDTVMLSDTGSYQVPANLMFRYVNASPDGVPLLFPFHRQGNGDSDKLSSSDRITGLRKCDPEKPSKHPRPHSCLVKAQDSNPRLSEAKTRAFLPSESPSTSLGRKNSGLTSASCAFPFRLPCLGPGEIDSDGFREPLQPRNQTFYGVYVTGWS